jgi:hypothetical protein
MRAKDLDGNSPGARFHWVAGPTNPSTGIDDFFIYDYWYCPDAFPVEFIGENPKWDEDYIRGETGGLKRHLIQVSITRDPQIDINPFSLLVCIENLQRYYTKKIRKLEEQLQERREDIADSEQSI